VILVSALDRHRGPAAEAVGLYQETESSRAARLALSEQRRAQRQQGTLPARRPTKRERRRIIRFRTGEA